MQGGFWEWISARFGADPNKLGQAAAAGWAWSARSGLVDGHQRSSTCLSFSAATKQTGAAQPVPMFWPQSLNACVSDASVTTGNGGDWRSMLIKCVSPWYWNHIALWSIFTHPIQYAQTQIFFSGCQLSVNTLWLSAVFSASKLVTTQEKKCYFLSKIC